MTLFNEEHLLLSLVLVEEVIDLLVGNQGILLGGNEDPRRGNETDKRLQIYLIYIEICLGYYNRFHVLVGNI
jgi:hypothetical protein